MTCIRKSSHPEQWHYISTENNPADHATRPIHASYLQHTNWLSGPSFLTKSIPEQAQIDIFTLVEPDVDVEIQPDVTTLITTTSETQLKSARFERFYHWMTPCRAIALLIHVARSFKTTSDQRNFQGWKCKTEVSEIFRAKVVIILTVQSEIFREEFKCLETKQTLPKQSPLKKLNPIIDEDGLLRVGGRLAPANMTKEEKHPLVIPHTHYVATLLVRYYHEKVAHQGRHITEGAIRAAGPWIIGGKCLVSSVIFKCVICRKLRGTLQIQKMADLPADRLSPMPPFTSVGLDVFGPWTAMTRRTRGGSADNKRWAVLFTCMTTRAVHIEHVESISTSSFINALRRFFSVRGPAKLLRSDRGTNFIGACKELKIDPSDATLNSYLQEKNCSWQI